MSRRRAIAAAAASVLLAAGCGNERTAPPDPGRPQPPTAAVPRFFDPVGIRLRSPGNWRVADGTPPQVATISSGDAVVAVWRYARREPLPRTRAQLDRARERLALRARERDPTLQVRASRVVRMRGVPGIEIEATGRIAGRVRRIRSLHLFARNSEVVVDAYAPPSRFAAVDASVFRPLMRTVRIVAPRGPDAMPAPPPAPPQTVPSGPAPAPTAPPTGTTPAPADTTPSEDLPPATIPEPVTGDGGAAPAP